MHNQSIARVYRHKRHQHGHCPILGMRITGVSTIFSFAPWVIYVPIGCRHPFNIYWQPVVAKTPATCSLLHPENERQRSVNSFSWCTLGDQGIVLIFVFINELLTALICKNTIFPRFNTDFKLIDIASCKACKNISLVVENTILIRYY